MKFKAIISAALLCALSTQSSAAPSAYVSKFGSLDLENFTNSTLLRDTENAQTIWVLPPTTGAVSMTNFIPSGNLGLCAGLKDLTIASNALNSQIKDAALRVQELQPAVEAAEKALVDANFKVAEAAQAPALANVIKVEDEIENLEGRQLELLTRMETCTQETCNLINEQYQDTRESLKIAKAEYKNLKSESKLLTQEYNRLKAISEARRLERDEIALKSLTLISKLDEIQSTIMRMYQDEGVIEGGFASLDYDLGWEQNAIALEKAYPEFDFKQVPTSNVRISANFKLASQEDSYLRSLPIMLGYVINGVPYLPWGENQDEQAEVALPNVIAGDVRMTLIGACPMARSDFFDDKNGGAVEFTSSKHPLFGIKVGYNYAAAYKLNMTAKFNLWKVYERISKSGKTGGFFSSKSYASVVENEWHDEDFHIDWKVNDPDSKYTESEREKIGQQLKVELMNRVLSSMAESVTGDYTMPNPGAPPAPGAIIFARGLNSVCGWNIYCKAGGWVLRGATGIWGSSKTEASYKRTQNFTASETWSSEYLKWTPAESTFKRS